MLSTGLAFQLPVLQLLLGALGLVNWKRMLSAWRWVVLTSALAGAVLTPSTDPITMLLLGGAITALFLIGVLLVAIVQRFKAETPPVDPPRSCRLRALPSRGRSCCLQPSPYGTSFHEPVHHFENLGQMLAIGVFREVKGLLFDISPHHLHIQTTTAGDDLHVVTGLPAGTEEGNDLVRTERCSRC